MSLREKLLALAELQKVDSEILAFRKGADVYPKQLAEFEKELAAARSAVEAERAKTLEVEQKKRSLELTIQDEKEKVKKWEARLSEQRSTREYAALAREIDIAKKANTTMTEELHELGRALVQAKDAVRAQEQSFAARQDQIGGKLLELRSKMGNAEKDAQALEVRRGHVCSSVDRPLLSKYEAVRKKRAPALVPVVEGACKGCHMNVPPQLYNNLRVSLGIELCPSCHRIIYAAEALEPIKA